MTLPVMTNLAGMIHYPAGTDAVQEVMVIILMFMMDLTRMSWIPRQLALALTVSGPYSS
jgi:hypothetical protein